MIASAFLIGVAGRVAAQANPDSIKHRNDCRLAAQTITTGQPAPKTAWAFAIIQSCGGDGIQALASAIRSMKSSVDTSFLGNLRMQAGYYQDGAIFASAMSVASDPSASAQARVFALLTLQSIVKPHSPSTYAEATSNIDASGSPACARLTTHVSDVLVLPGTTPLPSDYVQQVSTLAVTLYRDAGVPQLVRAAATCAM